MCLSRDAGEHPPCWRTGKVSSICPVSAVGTPVKVQWFGHEPKHQNCLKKHRCLPAGQQTLVWDEMPIWGCFPWAANQLSLGWEGGIMAVSYEVCFGVGSRQQNLAEIKEILEIPIFNILSFAFSLAWCFAWRF